MLELVLIDSQLGFHLANPLVFLARLAPQRPQQHDQLVLLSPLLCQRGLCFIQLGCSRSLRLSGGCA